MSSGTDCKDSGCTNEIQGSDIDGWFCNDTVGNMVILKHEMKKEDGSIYYLYSQYCHLPNIIVSNNQVVKQGDKIGTVGSTGMSSGPHLHFSISTGIAFWGRDRINNNPYNVVSPYEPGEFEYFDETETVTVTFNLNYTATDSETVPTPKSYSSSDIPDEALPKLDDRFGYTFEGWEFRDGLYAGQPCESSVTVLVDHPDTVYAVYEAV